MWGSLRGFCCRFRPVEVSVWFQLLSGLDAYGSQDSPVLGGEVAQMCGIQLHALREMFFQLVYKRFVRVVEMSWPELSAILYRE